MVVTPPPLSDARSRHDLVETAWWLRVLLILFTLSGLVSLISNSMQLELFLRQEWTAQEVESNDARQDLVGFFVVGIYVVTVFAFARWVLLANRHVRMLGAEGLAQTPGKAVLFFFVPVVNLFLPYRGMRELWRASHRPSAWKDVPAPAWLPVWWGFWLATNLFGRIAKVLGDRVNDLPSGILSTKVSIFQNLLLVVLGVLAWLVVARITAAQLLPSDLTDEA